jgi:hypothetical protein
MKCSWMMLMEEKCLQECEINHSFQTKSSYNLENIKNEMRENIQKIACLTNNLNITW